MPRKGRLPVRSRKEESRRERSRFLLMAEPGVTTPGVFVLPFPCLLPCFLRPLPPVLSFSPLASRCPHFSRCSFPSHLHASAFPTLGPRTFCSREKHIVRRNVHSLPLPPPVATVAASLHRKCLPAMSTQPSPLHSGASRFAIVSLAKRTRRWGKT